jgi:hypothetical protein
MTCTLSSSVRAVFGPRVPAAHQGTGSPSRRIEAIASQLKLGQWSAAEAAQSAGAPSVAAPPAAPIRVQRYLSGASRRLQCGLTGRSTLTRYGRQRKAGSRYSVLFSRTSLTPPTSAFSVNSNVRLHKHSRASAAAKRGHGPRNPEQVRCLHWRQPQGSRRGGSCRNA